MSAVIAFVLAHETQILGVGWLVSEALSLFGLGGPAEMLLTVIKAFGGKDPAQSPAAK